MDSLSDLKVLHCENSDLSDSRDFYNVNSLWIGDFGTSIKDKNFCFDVV